MEGNIMEVRTEYLETVKELIQFKLETAIEKQKGLLPGDETELEHIRTLHAKLDVLSQTAASEGNPITAAYFLELWPWNEFERHVIFLLLAFELDYNMMQLAALLHENNNIWYVTPVLAQESFEYRVEETDLFRMLQKDSYLNRLLLCETEQEENSHFKKLGMDSRMKSFLLDEYSLYEDYQVFMSVWLHGEELGILVDEQGLLPKMTVLAENLQTERKTAVCLYGQEGAGKKYYCCHLADKMGWTLAFLDFSGLSAEEEKYRVQTIQFRRECSLLRAVPVIRGLREEDIKTEQGSRKLQFILNSLFSWFHVIYLTADAPLYGGNRRGDVEWLFVEVEEAPLTASLELWKQEGDKYVLDESVSLETAANQFRLMPGGIQEAFRAAWSYCVMDGRQKMEMEDIRKGCLSLMEGSMEDRAVKVRPVYGWEQLVLPKQQKEQLFALFHEVKYRHLVYENWGLEKTMAYGTGVSVLLYGPPGTGKTMAAQVLGKELGMDLYRIQLAAVFSKYIGETEKNLQKIFEQAKRNRMILFFDEADVLFGRRTEVKSSNDKFSNMEAAYLLQQLEEYEGISILATNYYQNFDEAFKRRIRYMIEFPLPDQKSRLQIWKKAVPGEMPTEGIDYEFLSSFELTGSHIKNIVLQAAFASAAGDGVVTMKPLMRALGLELVKIGGVLTEEKSGEYYFEEEQI